MFVNEWKKRQRVLMVERSSEQSVDQIGLFGLNEPNETNYPVARTILSYLEGYLYEKRLPLHPSDNLRWLFGIDEDEVADAFEQVVRALGCPLPKKTVVLPKMETIDELIAQIRSYCESCRT